MPGNSSPKFNADELARRIPIIPAIGPRRSPKTNIWFFDSPKNDRRLEILGDVAFMHAVILEGDLTALAYEINPPILEAVDAHRPSQSSSNILVKFRSEGESWSELWICRRQFQSTGEKKDFESKIFSLYQQVATSVEAKLQVRSEIDLRGKDVLFDNWANLCACITRTRGISCLHEMTLLNKLLQRHHTIQFGSLFDFPDIDPALMNAAVALSLQKGVVQAELHRQLFGRSSIITWRDQ